MAISKKHAVFESVNMGSTHYAERIFDAVCDTDIDNGTFGYLGGLADGYSNIYKFTVGAKKGESVVVADQPEWTEDTSLTSNQRRDKFFIPAGVPFRVRVVKVNDEFGITIEGVTSDTQSVVTDEKDFAKNNVFLTVNTDGKLKAASSTDPEAVMEARIERKRMVGSTIVTDVRTYGHAYEMYEARIKVLA